MLVVKKDALFEMFDSVLIVSDLEISQSLVVLELSIVFVDSLGFLESGDREDVLSLLVHGDTIIEEGLP